MSNLTFLAVAEKIICSNTSAGCFCQFANFHQNWSTFTLWHNNDRK